MDRGRLSGLYFPTENWGQKGADSLPICMIANREASVAESVCVSCVSRLCSTTQNVILKRRLNCS